jgi:hypothetical protein
LKFEKTASFGESGFLVDDDFGELEVTVSSEELVKSFFVDRDGEIPDENLR